MPAVTAGRTDSATTPTVSLWRNRGFRLVWIGEGVSLLGTATSSVLLPLVAVIRFHAEPATMGLLSAAAWLPWLLIGLPVGAWVDGRSARHVMIASDIVAAVLVATVPFAAVAGRLSVAQLVVVALGVGACSVFFNSAQPRLVREIAPSDQQEQAFARLFGTQSAMQVAGPGLGGLLAQAVSAVTGLLVDAISYVVSAVTLWRSRPTETASVDAEPAVTESIPARIRAGIELVRRDRYLRYFMVMGGVSNFGLTGCSTLLVLFLVRQAHLSAGAVGAVLALGSVGGLIGATLASAAVRRLGTARALLRLQIVAGPPELLLAAGGPGWRLVALLVGVVLVGIGVVAGNVIRGGWMNRYVPPDMRARQLTAAQVVNCGTMPPAALLAGWLGATIGLTATLLIMASVHALGCLSAFVSPLRGRRDLPEAVSATVG